MSSTGTPADLLRAAPPSWDMLARLVLDAIVGPVVSWVDSVESPVEYPLRPASSGSATHQLDASSNDSTGGKLPGRHRLPTLRPVEDPITEDHAEMWQLVRAVQEGDGEAFGKLYDHYVGSVFRFIYFRVNDRALAEDFTSETFLRALRRITTLNYQGRDVGAWFMTIARNIVFDHAKSARFRLELTTGEILESGATEEGPELAVLTNLTNARLLAAVNELGDEQKECIVLRFLHGLSVAETAEVMGKNDGAIKALQHRAVKRLAALLGDDLR
ncbi:MAG TPA: sigma-70 family RNA polymerase sigma factor [Jatrophihabitans sp.]|nr:sigma-70 family RNA polymerase sigma factor [Jatrophihabitans sp.]